MNHNKLTKGKITKLSSDPDISSKNYGYQYQCRQYPVCFESFWKLPIFDTETNNKKKLTWYSMTFFGQIFQNCQKWLHISTGWIRTLFFDCFQSVLRVFGNYHFKKNKKTCYNMNFFRFSFFKSPKMALFFSQDESELFYGCFQSVMSIFEITHFWKKKQQHAIV